MGGFSREVGRYVDAVAGARGGKRQAQRLVKLLGVCAAMPEVGSAVWGGHLMIQVRERTFAYYLNNHHGDGRVALCAKSVAVRQRELVEEDPSRYYSPAYLGVSGWVGVRLDLRAVDWDEVRDVVRGAWLLQAPRKLAASFADT
ncbi:MAG: MmcQ/YjbR family DNA-binding protein [Phycisphaerales bacterium]